MEELLKSERVTEKELRDSIRGLIFEILCDEADYFDEYGISLYGERGTTERLINLSKERDKWFEKLLK